MYGGWDWTNFITTNFGLAQEAETDIANGNRPWPTAFTLIAIKIVSFSILDALYFSPTLCPESEVDSWSKLW